MTDDLNKRVERVLALDKARTQGDWNTIPWSQVQGHDDEDTGGFIATGGMYYYEGQPVPHEVASNIERTEDLNFIAAAPEMVSIILALQQELKERDEVIVSLGEKA